MVRNQTGRTLCSYLPLCFLCHVSLGFPGALGVKNPSANVGDLRDVGSIPGLGITLGEGNGNPLQYSCLEDPTERGAWWATVHGVSQSQTSEWLSIFTMSLCLGLSISCARWVRNELMMIEETVRRKGNSCWTLPVQSLCHFQLFATPWTTASQASLSITNSQSLLKLLSSPSPPASNLSQHQGLFKRVSSSQQVAKVLEFHLQHQSFQWTPRTDLL